jgi:hypothetical protein
MVKGLTVAQEPEGNELGFGKVDDICGERSARVTEGNDGRDSLLVRYSGSMAGGIGSREAVLRKCRVSIPATLGEGLPVLQSVSSELDVKR